MEFKKSYVFLLALASGLLLGLAWLPQLFPLIFVAWVPFFFMESIILNSGRKRKKSLLFALAWLVFFIWNFSTTWWLVNASLGGAALAIIANSLLMAFVYWVYLFSAQRIQSTLRILLFIPFWITFEYLHTDWDLSWIWLTLGHVFACKTNWIQWYEYTGVTGGTLWVLLVNVLLFILLLKFRQYDTRKKTIMISSIVCLLFFPILISGYVLNNYRSSQKEKKKETVKVLIVQPSIDPYVEKFNVPFPDQFSEMLEIVKGKIDSTTDYIVLPETFIISQEEIIYENNLGGQPYLQLFYDSLLTKYPKLTVVSGADTYYNYAPNEELLPTARKYGDGNGYYECFNSAIQLRVQKPIEVYHKSKLVPGVEMMPFPGVLGLLGDLAIDMGGTTGSLGRQANREVFDGPKGARVGPVICYESVFGEFVTEYVNAGANVLFIVTNDGWWGDTPGYKQHLAYGTLRAIETRRYIARSANTGISCVINDAGEVIHPVGWYEKTAFSYDVPLIEYKTFFARNGDVISAVLKLVAALTFLAGIFFNINYLRNKRK